MDWDQDGTLDCLSGCYWTEGADAGHIQILLGRSGTEFAAAKPLLNAAGEPLENVALAEGSNDRNITLNICTSQFAVDYDGNGTLDIVTGCFDSEFFLYRNMGDLRNPKLQVTPEKLDLTSPDHHAAPHLVDLDGDGKLEFLTGSSGGKIYLSRNTGSIEQPQWNEFTVLLDIQSESVVISSEEETAQPKPGSSTRIWTVDWNHDGLLDILVGDSITIQSPVAGLSKEEFEAKQKAWDETFQALLSDPKRLDMSRKYQEAWEKNQGEVDAELEKAFSEMQMQISEHYATRSEFLNERSTGHVWLYLQKPNSDASANPELAPANATPESK